MPDRVYARSHLRNGGIRPVPEVPEPAELELVQVVRQAARPACCLLGPVAVPHIPTTWDQFGAIGTRTLPRSQASAWASAAWE